jgi:valine dehydrogenase (NAD+)
MTIAMQSPSPQRSGLHEDDHERIVVRQDAATGLRMIVAVHSTALGPALGGLRLKRYPGGLREALDDVMALARTMTLKASAAGLDLGGGKAVILDDGDAEARSARLEEAAAVIDDLDGSYVTAEDIGTTPADMDLIARHTRYVVGRPVESGGVGDPSPMTAETVFRALRRGLRAATGSGELDGRRVGVVGLGKVGYPLAAALVDAGAQVVATDLDDARAERFASEHGGRVAPSLEAVLGLELDVLAPCAAGGMIDDALARSIRCRVIAGAANNPLTSRAVARTLDAREILFVPDFLANCGGLIHVAAEWRATEQGRQAAEIDQALPRDAAAIEVGRDQAGDVEESIGRAMERLDLALETAQREGTTPIEAAERQALERVDAARR